MRKQIKLIFKEILLKFRVVTWLYNFLKTRKLVEPLLEKERGIFVDCGGYDGCSAIKFLIANPNFDSISFEPNPELWGYYKDVPTTLVKKGVWYKNQTMNFWIDHIDADGSSTVATKAVLFGKPEENVNCKKINIHCISIPELIIYLSKNYDKIVLKLDIEGSEYDILESLLEQKLIDKIKKLYVEFHWQKCGFTKERHKNLVSMLNKRLCFSEWDAMDFAIHQGSSKRKSWRNSLVSSTFGDISKYQNTKIEISQAT